MDVDHTMMDSSFCGCCGNPNVIDHPNNLPGYIRSVRYQTTSVAAGPVTTSPSVFVRAPGTIGVERISASGERIRVSGLAAEEMRIAIRELWRELAPVVPPADTAKVTENPKKRKTKHEDHDEAELERPIKRRRGYPFWAVTRHQAMGKGLLKHSS
ncbi:hypothetical protein GQ53DRAFT_767851 [Thozetella sp. PMI_491]|nr:hypothetical protein GQ53DRAFT_767851 [Thozetella sp. PMI_491]